MRTRVKICGFTRIEDAVYAANLGVDAIGLVFHPSSARFVDIEIAAAIARAVPAFVNIVALFVDADSIFINSVINSVPISCLQFHGDELAEACRIYDRPYIKAIRMQTSTDLNDIEKLYPDACGLLLDTYHPNLHGGTGTAFDWSLIPAKRKLPLILAGGLTSENAQEAIRIVKPYALDVSSHVESSKGIKDSKKMTAFIRKTNQSIEIYD